MTTIDEMIRDLLTEEARYHEAEEASRRAYEASTAALKARQAAYDRLRVALVEGRAFVNAGHAVHKDEKGNLYIIPLAE